jgi:hypothetical protein
MKYKAFISYSHGQDAKLAPCLETALEKFAKPTFKRRALDIFRDSNDLSASPDLWGKIEDGLDGSEYFIDNSGIAYCFSLDGNFLKLSYLDGPERIFALDPEFILARMNDPEIMGTIARLSGEDKKRFLIEVNSNPE